MFLEYWQILLLAIYFWFAGVNAEFIHNHTCKMLYSIVLSLFWPILDIFGIRPKDLKKVPKYYRRK